MHHTNFYLLVLRSKHILLTYILVLLSPILMAEVVTLRSGQIIKGEILLQNEEVVIIRNSNGMRHQYPANEVVNIQKEEQKTTIQKDNTDTQPKNKIVSLSAQAMGGVLYVPYLGWGGFAGADLTIGTNLMNKKVYLGGGVGYRVKVIKEQAYSFIPLQVCMSSILGNKQNAPIVGMNIGYGFSTKAGTQGGICVGADMGWSFEINHETRLVLGLNAEWQQAQTDVEQIIEDKKYTNHMGVNFITVGAKIAILF